VRRVIAEGRGSADHEQVRRRTFLIERDRMLNDAAIVSRLRHFHVLLAGMQNSSYRGRCRSA